MQTGDFGEMRWQGSAERGLDYMVTRQMLFSRRPDEPYYVCGEIFAGVERIEDSMTGPRKIWRRQIQVTVSPTGRSVHVHVDGVEIPPPA